MFPFVRLRLRRLLLLLLATVPSAAGEAASVRVRCTTTKGAVDIDVHPEWAPRGAERYLDLVRRGHFNNLGLCRVNGELVQFGEDWRDRRESSVAIRHVNIQDDPKPPGQVANGMALKRGQMSYAGGGPNTRSASVFFTVRPNPYLGREPWEVPFAEVAGDGMERVVDKFYGGYGDFQIFKCPNCNAPDLTQYWLRGNEYLKESFPKLDYMLECHIVEPPLPSISQHTPHGLPAGNEEEYRAGGDGGAANACFLIALGLACLWLRCTWTRIK